jgi:hypothetical protein
MVYWWISGDLVRTFLFLTNNSTSFRATANYPRVRALILDASFDHVLPLAVAHMPSFAGDIVKIAIKEHFDLDVTEQLKKYDGPVRIIRRYYDEVVTSYNGPDEERRRRENRGNYLLAEFLKQRYPQVLEDDEDYSVVLDFLSASGHGGELVVCRESFNALSGYNLDYILPNRDLRSHLIRLLCSAHFYDVHSSHVVPLKAEEFRIPEPVDLQDFSKFLRSFKDL